MFLHLTQGPLGFMDLGICFLLQNWETFFIGFLYSLCLILLSVISHNWPSTSTILCVAWSSVLLKLCMDFFFACVIQVQKITWFLSYWFLFVHVLLFWYFLVLFSLEPHWSQRWLVQLSFSDKFIGVHFYIICHIILLMESRFPEYSWSLWPCVSNYPHSINRVTLGGQISYLLDCPEILRLSIKKLLAITVLESSGGLAQVTRSAWMDLAWHRGGLVQKSTETALVIETL